MKVVEEFATLQGEGKYIGVPSYFIRTTGCNLRCEWKNTDGTTTKCDTPYTSWNPEKGYDLNPATALEKMGDNISHVVVTGGEPTLQHDLKEIVDYFNMQGKQITIETNGTRFVEGLTGVFLSISPKMSNSYFQETEVAAKIHMLNNKFKKTVKQWMDNNDYQIKFVVNGKEDLEEIVYLKNELQIPNNKIYLMPQGITTDEFKTKEKELFEQCFKYGFNYTPRMHIDIFGNVRGI